MKLSLKRRRRGERVKAKDATQMTRLLKPALQRLLLVFRPLLPSFLCSFIFLHLSRIFSFASFLPPFLSSLFLFYRPIIHLFPCGSPNRLFLHCNLTFVFLGKQLLINFRAYVSLVIAQIHLLFVYCL